MLCYAMLWYANANSEAEAQKRPTQETSDALQVDENQKKAEEAAAKKVAEEGAATLEAIMAAIQNIIDMHKDMTDAS